MEHATSLDLRGLSRDQIRKNLFDVHLEALADALVAKRIEVPPLHPVHTLMEEHKIIVNGLHKLKTLVEKIKTIDSYEELGQDLDALKDAAHLLVEAELHHQREEDALFPRLEKYGITEPPAILKGEHVEFRKRKRALYQFVNAGGSSPFSEFKETVVGHGEYVCRELESHILKEDTILYQVALQVFSEEDWKEVKNACDKIGYCCFKPMDQRPNKS